MSVVSHWAKQSICTHFIVPSSLVLPRSFSLLSRTRRRWRGVMDG